MITYKEIKELVRLDLGFTFLEKRYLKRQNCILFFIIPDIGNQTYYHIASSGYFVKEIKEYDHKGVFLFKKHTLC